MTAGGEPFGVDFVGVVDVAAVPVDWGLQVVDFGTDEGVDTATQTFGKDDVVVGDGIFGGQFVRRGYRWLFGGALFQGVDRCESGVMTGCCDKGIGRDFDFILFFVFFPFGGRGCYGEEKCEAQ